jgi:hypothetical protein
MKILFILMIISLNSYSQNIDLRVFKFDSTSKLFAGKSYNDLEVGYDNYCKYGIKISVDKKLAEYLLNKTKSLKPKRHLILILGGAWCFVEFELDGITTPYYVSFNQTERKVNLFRIDKRQYYVFESKEDYLSWFQVFKLSNSTTGASRLLEDNINNYK